MRRHLVRTTILAACFAASVAGGYVVSARLGAEAVRREAQEQLSRLLAGAVQIGRVRVAIRGGLFLEGDRVGVYPREAIPHRPALFASSVSAELDVLALLAGRFRLSKLVLDEVVMQVERDAAGTWSPTPIRALDERRRRAMPDDMERNLALAGAFEAVARFLLSEPIIARQVEIRRARLTYIDNKVLDEDGRPLVLKLSGVEGRLVHRWLSGDADLALSGELASRGRPQVSLRAEGSKRRGGELNLALTARHVPLDVLQRFTRSEDSDVRLGGSFSGRISFDTRSKAHDTVTLRGSVEDLSATIPLGEDAFYIDQKLTHVAMNFELHPGRVRMSEARLETPGTLTRMSGAMERPLRHSAQTSFEIEVEGLELDEVRTVTRALPGRDARTLENLLAEMESGRIDRIGGSGTARFSDWRKLLRREVDSLPPGFGLRAEMSGIRLQPAGGGSISRLGGTIELMGDRMTLRNARALWNGEPLPRLSLTIVGISNLFKTSPEDRPFLGSSARLPGLGPLSNLLQLQQPQPAPDEPQSGEGKPPLSPPLRLRVEVLDHPALGWPIRNARMTVQPAESKVEITIHEAQWAAAPTRGLIVFSMAPEEAIKVHLDVGPPTRAARGQPVSPPASTAAASSLSPTRSAPIDVAVSEQATDAESEGEAEPEVNWASGHFEIDAIEGTPLPLRLARGHFGLHAATLQLSQLRADLTPSGKLVADATLDLSDPERVPILVNFSLVGCDVARVGQVVGFPDEFATGKVHFAGSFDGIIRPQTPILLGLQGAVSMDARNGEIYRKLPLIVAIAQASEGFNRQAEKDALVYESVKAEFSFDHGLIATNNFEIEGPLRVHGSGSVDTSSEPFAVTGVVGVFLFRGAGNLMKSIPLVKAILPGSEKGLVGAYFNVTGSLEDPQVDALTAKSLADGLPGVLAAPFKILGVILGAETSAPNEMLEVHDESREGEDQ